MASPAFDQQVAEGLLRLAQPLCQTHTDAERYFQGLQQLHPCPRVQGAEGITFPCWSFPNIHHNTSLTRVQATEKLHHHIPNVTGILYKSTQCAGMNRLQMSSLQARQYAPVTTFLRCSHPVTPTLCRCSVYPDIPRHHYTTHRRSPRQMHRKARHHAELGHPDFLT